MQKKHLVLFALIVLKVILQIIAIDSGYELHRDEYLHLDLGKHLAWGYSSVPPITGLISFIILKLGNSLLLVKFFPVFFGVLLLVLVWKCIEELNGGIYAQILGGLCIVFSIYLRINTLYQPNSLDFLLWTAVFYSILKYINSENNKWLWIAAFWFGLGFLNKYNIAFLVMGLVPAMLISRQRKVFLNKNFYFSILLALLIITPNLIWQIQNSFPVFKHLNELAATQLVNINRVDFFREQLLFFMGSFFIIILALFSFYTYPPFKKYRIFFWSYFFTLGFFSFFKAKGYYALGLYPVLFAFGSVYTEKLLAKGSLRYIKPAVIIIPALLFVMMFKLIVPVLTPKQIIEDSHTFAQIGLLRWEDGNNHAIPQDYADMLGWKELAGLVDQAFDSVAEKSNTLIHCDNYGQAGAINYYSKQNFTQAVTLNADYINWYPLDTMEIRNVILVQVSEDTDKNREREKPWFEEIKLIGEIKNEYAREKGARVYLLKGARVSINKILEEEINSRN